MTFLIPCPNCGSREASEFNYGGETTKRPAPGVEAGGMSLLEKRKSSRLSLVEDVNDLGDQQFGGDRPSGGFVVTDQGPSVPVANEQGWAAKARAHGLGGALSSAAADPVTMARVIGRRARPLNGLSKGQTPAAFS